MTIHTHRRIAIAAVAALSLNVLAGPPTTDSKISTPVEPDSFGRLTLGGKFSEDLQSGYLDMLSGLYRSDNSALFINLRGTLDDNDQQLFSVGLGYRYLIEDPGIIIGANVYYDYLDSTFGNEINQLGFGAEILTKWVDARFNYYLPESGRELVRTFQTTGTSKSVGPLTATPTAFTRPFRTTSTTTTFGIFEEGLEGWNAEAGVLIPGLDEYFELRIFAGGYSYQDPKGGDIAGFKARAEARVTEGITLDLEYWEDEELVGGNWVGGVRVSLPFDIGKLFTGGNPFEGAGETFSRVGQKPLRARMDQFVHRSHRIQTGTTSPQPIGSSTTTNSGILSTDRDMPPVTKPPTSGGGRPPEQSEGSPEQSEGSPEGQEVPPEGFIESPGEGFVEGQTPA